jgi:transposase-like protein
MNNGNDKFPKTLLAAIKYFSDLDVAHAFFVDMRWPNGVECPTCGSKDARYLPKYRRFQCNHNHDHRQFTVKTGTIMEDSPMTLDKWAVAFWLEVNAKNSISSYEIHRAIGITQKSAWFMLHRIRLAVQQGSFNKLTGEVESDESYIGGLTRNMHHARRLACGVNGRGGNGKTIIHGILQRGDKKAKKTSKVVTSVIPDTKLRTLSPIIHNAIEAGSNLYTDTLAAYTSHSFSETFIHEMIDHAQAYVKGRCHTNGLENFWSLFKRCVRGTHVSIEPFHLMAYLDSETFRFNNRENNDSERFRSAVSGFAGKRLTYKALTGALEVVPGSDNDAGKENLPN